MAFTNLLGFAYSPVRLFLAFLHHSNRLDDCSCSGLVKVRSAPLTEVLKDLHPYLRLPYNASITHFLHVAKYTPDIFYHYHFVASKDVATSAETRLLRALHQQIKEEKATLEKLQEEVETEKKVYSPVVQCLLQQKERCTSNHVGQYEYSICIGREAKQDSVRLGKWKIDVDVDYEKNSTVVFEEGQRCWNGIERSLTVKFECGKAEEIVSLMEPSTCKYQAVMKSPCFCTESVVKSIESQLV